MANGAGTTAGQAPESLSWGFIGAGKMATALIRGLIRSGRAGPDRIAASDPVDRGA